jgi:hypothetical protein
MERNLVAGLFHAAASLGIAESADAMARQGIAGRVNGDARPRMRIAENAIDLAAARGVLSRAALLIDQHRSANLASDGSADEFGALFAEAQAAKAFVNEAATRTVDRALALSGGAGYVNGSPLARAYRDVKAGSFITRSAPTAPTTTSATSRSAKRLRCIETSARRRRDAMSLVALHRRRQQFFAGVSRGGCTARLRERLAMRPAPARLIIAM